MPPRPLALTLGFLALFAPATNAGFGAVTGPADRPLQDPAPKGPLAKFSADAFDFGKVRVGTSPARDLVIENVGDAPLEIRRVGVTCECATLRLSTPRRPNVPIATDDEGRVALALAPGDRATLKLTIDTSKLPAGPFEKRLLVVCSDPKNGALSLPFKLQIEHPVAPNAAGAELDEHGHAPHEPETMGASRTPTARRDEPVAPPIDPAVAPRLEVDTYKIDFKTVYRGEKLKHTFKLKNAGHSDLTVNEIRNSCACAASRLRIDGRTIEEKELKESKRLGILSPGEEAELDVELKTAVAPTPGKDAPLSKPVRIHTNDPARAVTVLTIEATMISPFTVEPERFDFGVLRKGAGAKLSATLRSDQLGDFKVTQATSPNPELMQVRVEPVAGATAAERAFRVDVEVSAAAPLGSFASHVELALSHERVKEIVIPVHLNIEPNVVITDNRPDKVELLDFEVMSLGHAKTVELTIENGDRAIPYLLKDVAIGSCRPSPTGFAVEMVEVEKGMKYTVKLTAPPEIGAAKYFQGDLVLNAEHPDLPLRKVRFRGWYKDEKQGSPGNRP